MISPTRYYMDYYLAEMISESKEYEKLSDDINERVKLGKFFIFNLTWGHVGFSGANHRRARAHRDLQKSPRIRRLFKSDKKVIF